MDKARLVSIQLIVGTVELIGSPLLPLPVMELGV